MSPSLTYSMMIVEGKLQSGGCGRWIEFMERLDTFSGGPVVAMSYLQVEHLKSANYMYQCHDPTASSKFAESLKHLLTGPSVSSPNTIYCDDGRKWTTQMCSEQDIALCINCDSPCEEPGATHLNSCKGANVYKGNDELKILSFKFNTTIPEPSLSNLTVPGTSIQKDQVVVEIDINAPSYVYCDIYESLSAAQSATNKILVSRGVASYPSSDLKVSITFFDLKPSTFYYVACTADIDPKTSLSSTSDVEITSFSTSCCIPLTVDISYPHQVLINSYVSSLIHVSSNWPLKANDGIVLTPTLKSVSGVASDCLFSPSSLNSLDATDSDSRIGGVYIDLHSCSNPPNIPFNFSIVITGVNAENYEIKYASKNVSLRLVAEEEEIDPSLVSARFKNSLKAVEIKFDRPIQAENLQVSSNVVSSAFTCSILFAFLGADGDKCTFDKDRSSILIFFNHNSVLLPADSITLLPSKLTPTSISQSVDVLPPMRTKYPEVNVITRTKIGAMNTYI